MDVVWSRGFQRFAVSDVLSVLEKRRDVAYTTVMTTLGRLHEKGLLTGGPADRESLALLVETVSSADAGALDELERVIKLRRKELGS